MSNFGIATEAPAPAEAAEYNQRHLRSVENVAAIAVASEYTAVPEVSVPSNEQILFSD